MKNTNNNSSKFFQIAMLMSFILAVYVFNRQLLRLPAIVFEAQDYPRGFESIGIDYLSVYNSLLFAVADMTISSTFMIIFFLRQRLRRRYFDALIGFLVYMFVRFTVDFLTVRSLF